MYAPIFLCAEKQFFPLSFLPDFNLIAKVYRKTEEIDRPNLRISGLTHEQRACCPLNPADALY
ncbi:hypothetical protein [Treponema phagedenis]|uniref:hypothetical protein n=1 Tax=Treponema phagedenis TaxID=162 RepID=UPI0004AE6467|nr:hypothetical protein [Treponema phagedenis]NVP24895.1 hypothetical protein [Treponema phagedenis]QKS91646.1 hypothetical protein HPJ96_03070 [Treponema phagedenis]QLC59069.1 hypothetical protein HW453_09875 [Treponema phagedenis]